MVTRSMSRKLVGRRENLNAYRKFGPIGDSCKGVAVVNGKKFYVVENMEKDLTETAREWDSDAQKRIELAVGGAIARGAATMSTMGGIERITNLAFFFFNS